MARETRPEAIPIVSDGPPPKVIARLADEILPTLIARLDRSRLGELEVRQDGWRIRLRRTIAPDGVDATTMPAPAAARRSERRSERQPGDRVAEGHAAGRPHPLRGTDRASVIVSSPAVGYYLPRDGVAIGNTVRAGDLLGHVDVLGVRQDVVVPEDGLLASLEAESGEAVEYGQPLARVELQERRG